MQARLARAGCVGTIAVMSADVLIVEDDLALARLVALHLRRIGLSAEIVADGEAAIGRLRARGYRLVVLDRMLPGAEGLEVLRWLRTHPERKTTPVLVLTALGEASARVEGLEAGADDYLAKPFEPAELVARAKALLRRAEGFAETPAGLVLNPDAHEVRLGARAVRLRPLEFRLLAALAKAPGRTRTREWLLDHVWGWDAEVEPRAVDAAIRRLRAALAEIGADACIETIRKLGYRYRPPA